MYDLAVPAEAPGTCPKCRGTGVYCWGGTVSRSRFEGSCHSCRGTGKQDVRQIKRASYNRFKIAQIGI